MPQNYTITEIPGKTNLRVATTDTTTPEDGGVKSPEWMIKIDDMLKSEVENFNDYCELFGWYGESSRLTTGDISNQLFTSATLKHSDLVIIIPNGGYGAQLETKMNLGIPLNEVQVVRLGNVKSTKVKLQVIDYTLCRIQSFQQQLDRLVICLNISAKTNTVFVYDVNGNNKGQMVNRVDYAKNTAE
ncbi:hypothetical protein [Candidatus Finniella inopinata]|uniref:Uncharacterized protein n=1 Tax=Candidatus Finniella inopinata TaxID=1696036 RepID=A0A4Q7DGR6_9PROT|nr:hypothetical protein [Candidatus Finniella inopinata]RZI45872.1 hypothetical protein EQU50_05420 [Candidatus Finniella inopinata]